MAASNASPPATLGGIPLKVISLVTLTAQNSALTILLHYSRISVPADQQYSAASAVLLNELLKMSISIAWSLRNSVLAQPRSASMVGSNGSSSVSAAQAEKGRANALSGHKESFGELWRSGKVKRGARQLKNDVFSSDCWKLSIPACLYVVQNNLQFVAASNLDVPTFQVSYNLKILTTALCSVVMLRRRLSIQKWFALILLAIGVATVQLQASAGKSDSHAGGGGGAEMNRTKGLSAVVAACMTSGLAGVYFEMVLKGSKVDLWVRNVQLSIFSIVPAFLPVFFPHFALFGGGGGGSSSSGMSTTEREPFLAHFGFWAWSVVLIQVLGGLVTALVIRYSDNIVKGFATSLAIIISSFLSFFLFDFKLTLSFLCGAIMVVGATWIYNQPDPLPVVGSASSSLSMMNGGTSSSGGGYTQVPTDDASDMEAGSIGGRGGPHQHHFALPMGALAPTSSSSSSGTGAGHYSPPPITSSTYPAGGGSGGGSGGGGGGGEVARPSSPTILGAHTAPYRRSPTGGQTPELGAGAGAASLATWGNIRGRRAGSS